MKSPPNLGFRPTPYPSAYAVPANTLRKYLTGTRRWGQDQSMPDNHLEGTTHEELTQDDVFRLLEQAASEDHPNPERLGCPAPEILRAFAQDPKRFDMRDPIFEHLSNCSPCFRVVQSQRT